MPGIGLVIDGAVQHAPQWSRQFIGKSGHIEQGMDQR
jgi:hypothetical protein